MTKENRIDIFNETVRNCKDCFYTNNNGEEISIDGQKKMMDDTIFYGKKISIQPSEKKFETNIMVVNDDTLYAAKKFLSEGTTAVLNMASFHTPGGGVTRGSSAQEESLFRRTNLHKSLYQFHYVGDEYGIPQREERYPLQTTYGAIYTPNVTVFRNVERDGCEFLDEPYKVNVITMAAIKQPPINEDGTIADWAKDILRKKVAQMLSIGYVNGNENLILGAFGCGAYGTPPNEMAKIFHEVIYSDTYYWLFKNICFAIFEDGNAFKKHNPQGNLKPFMDVFKKKNS